MLLFVITSAKAYSMPKPLILPASLAQIDIDC